MIISFNYYRNLCTHIRTRKHTYTHTRTYTQAHIHALKHIYMRVIDFLKDFVLGKVGVFNQLTNR